MSYPGFDKDLYGIYTSEVMGEALFATAGEPAFFDYVLQHELAITRFAEGELAGESDALADVEQLLTGAYAQMEGSRNA